MTINLLILAHTAVAAHKKEDTLLLLVFIIGILFWAFWVIILWKTYRLPAASREMTDIDKTFSNTRRLTNTIAFLSILMVSFYAIYVYYNYNDHQEIPSQENLFMMLGILSFGLTPYTFRKVFNQMKLLKSKQSI